jgi:hypothetical protein
MCRNYFVTIGHFACITAPSYAALSPGDRVILSACPGGFGRMADENDRPPLARRVPGATQAGPADPERRRPPELTEEFRQRIQAVVSAAHAQAAREAEQQRGGQPDQSGRSASTRMARRGSTQADGSKSPNGLLQSVMPNLLHKHEGRLSDQDAEFDTAPIPRLTTAGTVADPTADPVAAAADASPADWAESNGATAAAQTNGRVPTPRQESGGQHKHSSRQTGAQDQRPQAQLGTQQEEERGAQATHERTAAEERTREERERASQQERERAAEERARQQHERQAKREQKRTARQERAAERARTAENRRTARQELARALQERAREEQERAAQLDNERALEQEERAEKERIRLEQELEDRQWAAQRRARQEREREEAEARARLEERARLQDREEAEAVARQEQERAAQLELDHAREEEDRAHLEQQRKAVERARQEWERKEAEDRARQEQEREQAEKRAREEKERAAQLELDRAREEEEHARLETQRKEAEDREREQAEAHAREEKERAAQLELDRTREEEDRARLETQRKEAEDRERRDRERRDRERRDRERRDRERRDRENRDRKREQAQKLAPAAAEAERPGSPDPVAGPAAQPKRAGKPTARPESAGKPTEPEKPAQRKVAAAVLTAPEPVAQPEPGERAGLRRYRVPAAIAAALVLVASGSLLAARSMHSSAYTLLTPAKISATTRNQAAAWIVQQVSSTAVMSCDPLMCRALKAHGAPAFDLRTLAPGASSFLGSQVVVATAAIRKQFGSSLTSVYAPAVLASFGSGTSRIDVRLIAPHGSAAFMRQFRADQKARKTAASALLTLNSIALSPSARSQLASGQVDSRMIVLLDYLAPVFRLNVVTFGDSGPGATAGMPLRSLTLKGRPASLRSVLTYVRTHETGPYLPEYTQITEHHGTSELIIEFSAPSPLGVFENP